LGRVFGSSADIGELDGVGVDVVPVAVVLVIVDETAALATAKDPNTARGASWIDSARFIVFYGGPGAVDSI
jgi:hypothetical protein